MEPELERVTILGVKVNPLSVPRLHALILDFVKRSQHKAVLNVNVHCLNLAYQDRALRQFLNDAEIVFCDGAGAMLGAKILGYHIPRRITYADWFWELAGFATDNQLSLFFLGARPGVAAEAAAKLKTRFPNLRIVGTHHGYFDKTPGSEENETVVQAINNVQPNILVVGFGMPLQERWLMQNWHGIEANVALTGGAVFDYVSGSLKRAPRWMTDHGLEWLGRLMIEPTRLWRRYLIGNPLFLWRVLKQRFGLVED